MSSKLYVGGLPWGTGDEQLAQAFARAGTVVSAVVIKDKFTGRSKGFGFVEMGSEQDAQSAIEMFHGKDFEGRVLTVNEARPMEERPRKSYGPAPFSQNRRFDGPRDYRQGQGGRRFGSGRNRQGQSYDDRGGRDW
jgi:RNA recognition motif-containing protein